MVIKIKMFDDNRTIFKDTAKDLDDMDKKLKSFWGRKFK